MSFQIVDKHAESPSSILRGSLLGGGETFMIESARKDSGKETFLRMKSSISLELIWRVASIRQYQTS